MAAMHFDLFTLYGLAIGTLLVSAGMTVWERQAMPHRRGALATLAAGYGTLATGCAMATARTVYGGAIGSALSSLVIVAGYLLILNGVAAPGGRRYHRASAAILIVLAIAWIGAGKGHRELMWNYASAVPIAMVSALTAWEALHSETLRTLRARWIVAAVLGVHAAIYLIRATVLPGLVAAYGPDVLTSAATITLYDGVLYSVCLPMALLALVREEAHRDILRVSQTDYLTGLGTRRWFFERGEHLLRPGMALRPTTLLVFDLDHFKTINDRHGHATGDAVLRAFGEIVRVALAPGTLTARLGGEEFGVLLPDVDVCRAREIGAMIARRFAETVVTGAGGVGVTATVSIGLAEVDADFPDLTDLLAAADRALYLAKALGRNRIEIARPARLAEVA